MTEIIDNIKSKASDKLSNEISTNNEIAIATAYFNVRGFSLLRDVLNNKPLRLLLGREPGSNIAYKDEILKELENEEIENEDNFEFLNQIKSAYDYFSSPQVQVKIVDKGFFHGKAYLGAYPSLKEIQHGFGMIGSSNFTYGGLYTNRELNMLTTDREAIKSLSEWFENMWGESRDFKDEFLSFLSSYVITHSPYEIVAKALYETLKNELEEAMHIETLKDLKYHQKLSVSNAWSILERYNGVIIADPVGLGKTRVGIALAHLAQRIGMKPLIIAPKNVLETTWKKEMDNTIGMYIPNINTELISSNPDILSNLHKDKDFIIIDEAHYFRSSNTRRYEGLVEYLSKKGRKLVLITATPINNSLMDLYNLLILFIDDDGAPDISPSLKGYFAEQQKKLLNEGKIDLDAVLRRFVVRISRETAEKISNGLKFPSRVIDTNGTSYQLLPSPKDISEFLDRLSFIYYDFAVEKQVEKLTLPDGTVMSFEQQLQNKEKLKDLVRNVIKFNFFKRFESSKYSLKMSILNLKAYIEKSIKVAEQRGKFLPPKLKNKVYEDEDGFIFVGVDEDQISNLSFTNDEKNLYIKKAKEDIDIIDEMVKSINNLNDNKFEVFKNKLLQIKIDGNNGVIIFTSFSDTAEYIYSELSKINGIKEKLFIITGSKAEGPNTKDRYEIISKFTENGGYLISTDVLSSGQNLQNAQYLFNYDFPWNPVILIQRTGRIDRMNSPYQEIYIINITPLNKNKEDPESLEYFINLMAKLRNKIEGIRQGIGTDVSILGEEPLPKDFNILLEILKGNNAELKEIEEMGEKLGIVPWGLDPREIFEEIKEKIGEEKIRAIPMGSGAYKYYNKNGIFILYRYKKGESTEYFWLLKFEDGEIITDMNKIIKILMQDPKDNKGEKIDYKELKYLFIDAKNVFLEKYESKFRKTFKPIPKDLRTILEYVYKDESLFKYVPVLINNVNPIKIKILKKALDEGTLIEKLKELYPNPEIKEDAEEYVSPKDIHRVVWCVLRKSL
jgi:ERCC4-related helicase